MSHFEFRLDSLLKLRQAECQRRRAEVEEAFRAQQQLSEQIGQTRREIDEMRQRSLADAAPGRIDVARLSNAQRYQQVLRGQLLSLSQQQSQWVVELEERRLALVEADRQLRVLEKLRDRHLRVHQGEQQRREIKALDEVAAHQRHARA